MQIMRLIDADALMEEIFDELSDGEVLYSIPPDRIDDAPTIDAVEVVRCKDCIHTTRSKVNPEKIICCLTLMCGTTKPDFFCARGERKEVENGKSN